MNSWWARGGMALTQARERQRRTEGFPLATPAVTNDIVESDFRGVEDGMGRTQWVGKKC